MKHLIKRNTAIPTKAIQTFSTSADNEGSIRVFESDDTYDR